MHHFLGKMFKNTFELRGIQTRPPFSGNILNQPMMKGQNYIANDVYDNANDMMKNGVLLRISSRTYERTVRSY